MLVWEEISKHEPHMCAGEKAGTQRPGKVKESLSYDSRMQQTKSAAVPTLINAF